MTPTTADIIDITQLFQRTFGRKPYVINKEGEVSNEPGEAYQISGRSNSADKEFTAKGSVVREQYLGVEILLPVRFYLNQLPLMYLPYCVVNIHGKKTIVKTPMVQRKGTVKEQYNIDDYSIGIKGFLIGRDRKFPEAEINNLRQLFEAQTAVQIDNALTNIFLTDPALSSDEQRRVVIEDFDLPEVQGGREYVRPFTMQLESDSVFTLELDA